MSQDVNKSLARNGVVLLLAIALGGLGVYFANNYINTRVSFYKSQMETKEELSEVVVPKKNLVRGELITGEVLALREFPKKYIDSNAVTKANYQVAIGQKLDFDIDEGKPLLWAHLDGGIVPTFSGRVEDGFRALTIPVDKINSISGFLQPQDKVDLLLTYDGNEVDKTITFPFMQNLEVLATGVKTVVDKTGRTPSSSYSTITVQVSPSDAKRLILAREIGDITATLRHPDDEIPMSNRAMGVRDILGEHAKPLATIRRPTAAKKKGIEFIVGGSS